MNSANVPRTEIGVFKISENMTNRQDLKAKSALQHSRRLFAIAGLEA